MAETPPPITMPRSPVGSTQSIDDRADDRRPRVFPCEACGADLTFSIGQQSLECSYCGFVKAIELDPDASVTEQDFRGMLERVTQQRDQHRDDEQGFKEVRCDACGAVVRFAGTLTSTECAYCGVALQLADVYDAPHRVPVDGVLPFLIDRDKARTNLGRWVRSRWFAPNEFKARGAQGRFNGIYLPYWTFDSLTANRYTGARGQHYYVTVGTGKSKRRARRTRWYPASGHFQRFFDDVLVVAATGLPQKRISALEPWPLNKCTPFSQQVLAGFLARTYDIPLDDGFVAGKTLMDTAITVEVKRRIGGDVQRIDSIHTHHDAITYKHLILPVWMLAYRYGKKSYQVVVNAGTGEVQGDRPYSWVKITLAAVVALLAAASVGLFVAQMQ